MPRKHEKDLDEALAQTFPASDPFTVGQYTGTEPPARPVDRRAPLFEKEAVGGLEPRELGGSPRDQGRTRAR